MSWQDDEIQRRVRLQNEQTLKLTLRNERIALQKIEIHKFLDKIIQANNRLDPIIRVGSIADIYNWEFEPEYPCNRSLHIRYDIMDRCLYLVQSKEIRYGFGLGDVKRNDYLHYKITEAISRQFIDVILKNICTNQAITNGLPGYIFTIKGMKNYRDVVGKNYI